MVDYLLRCGAAAGSAAAVDRDAAARVRPGAARRPHTPGRGDRADLHPDGPRARRRGIRRRGRLARLPAPRLRHVAADRGAPRGATRGARRPARAARPRHLGRDRRRELPRHARVRRPRGRGHRRRPATAASGSAAARSRSSTTATRRRLLARSALPALRGALLADADGVVLEVDRSPEAVAFASSRRGARGEPGRRAVPRPPDPHEAQAARRRLRPGSGRRRRAARDASGPASPSTRAWYRDYYERNVDDETPPVPDRPGRPARRARPGRRHRHERAATRPGRGSRATSTTGRSRSRTPPTRSAASAR